MRAFKTVNDSYIEPISFIVPRRAEVFQSDIYPPTTGSKPAMSAAEWFDGKEGLPPKIDLESVYSGEEPTEVPESNKPAALPTQQPSPTLPSPVKKEPEPPKAIASPSIASRGPPPSMKAQQGSIAAIASKFTDNDNEGSEDEEDDSSSFEEVPKPIDRSHKPVPSAAGVAERAPPTGTSRTAERAEQLTIKSDTSQPAVRESQPTPSQTSKEILPEQTNVSNVLNFPHPFTWLIVHLAVIQVQSRK